MVKNVVVSGEKQNQQCYYNTFVFHAVTLKDAKYYEVPSSSAEEPNRVVITFTTESTKDYPSILPPTESSTPNTPTSQIYDVKVSFYS